MEAITFINKLAAQKKALGHERTAANYRATARALARFLDQHWQGPLILENIRQPLINDFEHHLLYERHVCKNTSSFYMRQLRATYNEAVRQCLCQDTKPFCRVYTGIDQTCKRAAKPETLSSLFKLRLDQNPSLEFARDLFHFAFLGRGIAFIDMAKLKTTNIQGDLLIYRRSKTGQLITVALLPAMRRIIKRWHVKAEDSLFPLVPAKPTDSNFSTALRIYNRRLTALSELCGNDMHLNSYTARHSWASEAYRLGVPIQSISECMGHTTERTTRIYIQSLSTEHINAALKPFLDAYS